MSIVKISPTPGPLDAVIRVPGSKSVANRALVCAMLAKGESVVSGLPDGDDTAVVVAVLEESNRLRHLNNETVVVSGDSMGSLPGIVDARLAGTSSRFLTAVAAVGMGTTVIDGESPLRGRPMADLHNALKELGADITPLGEDGHLPVSVSRGRLVGGSVSIRGDVSSQFISALMLIGPVLPEGLELHIEGELVSRSYVEMTRAVMHAFGATVQLTENKIIVAPSGYEACNYVVEPDYSSAAFPIAALLIAGGTVRIPHLATSDMQGDSAMVDIAKSMGATVHVDGFDLVFERDCQGSLMPLTMNMEDCSDLVPAVVLACSVAGGTSELTGIGFIRQKESDRLGDVASELAKAGADIRVNDDGLTISGVSRLKNATFDTHHDHRLAMAFALAALSSGETRINDSHVVSKSWPNYFEDMVSILGEASPQN